MIDRKQLFKRLIKIASLNLPQIEIIVSPSKISKGQMISILCNIKDKITGKPVKTDKLYLEIIDERGVPVWPFSVIDENSSGFSKLISTSNMDGDQTFTVRVSTDKSKSPMNSTQFFIDKKKIPLGFLIPGLALIPNLTTKKNEVIDEDNIKDIPKSGPDSPKDEKIDSPIIGPDSNNDIQWLVYRTELDQRVCHICKPCEGKKFRPYDPDLIKIPQHHNCRCNYDMVTDVKQAILKLKDNLKLAKLEIDHKHRIEFEQRGIFKGAKYVENKSSKFWEYFLLTAKDINGNGWGVSPDTIDTNIRDFIGQPFVITAKSWIPNSEYGTEYTHPYIPTNHIPTIFAHQNKFAVGIIREVIKKGDDYSAMVEPFPKYASLNPPPFCSPGIFQTNRSEPEGNIRSWRALHLAGLDAEPAYGSLNAIFKGSCQGTKDECKVSFHGAKLITGIECPILQKRFERIKSI